jgi:hypothetical protein
MKRGEQASPEEDPLIRFGYSYGVINAILIPLFILLIVTRCRITGSGRRAIYIPGSIILPAG